MAAEMAAKKAIITRTTDVYYCGLSATFTESDGHTIDTKITTHPRSSEKLCCDKCKAIERRQDEYALHIKYCPSYKAYHSRRYDRLENPNMCETCTKESSEYAYDECRHFEDPDFLEIVWNKGDDDGSWPFIYFTIKTSSVDELLLLMEKARAWLTAHTDT
jgi:hypothetical protein